ncbi:hypothetical protein EV182_000689 [Spiromyces aspiralis]|uniref:Uncharacterized protein n=1 Tax=Spiromyces aspiralis TaxID=68401 RepID=A0ACC1HXN3_9FUNG|nr:hypothetical protein EV182_000689 [Spiromyces aspiralis]
MYVSPLTSTTTLWATKATETGPNSSLETADTTITAIVTIGTNSSTESAGSEATESEATGSSGSDGSETMPPVLLDGIAAREHRNCLLLLLHERKVQNDVQVWNKLCQRDRRGEDKRYRD